MQMLTYEHVWGENIPFWSDLIFADELSFVNLPTTAK